MEELLIINPRKRGAKRRSVKRNAAGRFVKESSAPKRRRRNPVAAANPAPRYRARIRKAKRARRRNPASRSTGAGNFTSMLIAGLQGGLGAVAVDTVVGYLPLPDAMKTGYGKHAVRVAAAVALGAFGRRFIGPMARSMSAGALAVTMRDVVKEAAATAGLQLGEYTAPAVQFAPRYAALPAPQMSGYGMGEYVSPMTESGEYQY